MLACYINLEKRTDRRAFMENQFASLGLAVERIEATTPETVDARNLAPLSMKDVGETLSPPEAACSVSHFRAWRHMLDQGHERILVLEDDVLLSRELPEFIAAIERKPTDIDILRLETRLTKLQVRRRREPAPPGFSFHMPLSYEHGSGAYVISADCAARILSSPRRFELPMDDLLFSLKSPYRSEAKIRVAVPALALHGVSAEFPAHARIGASDTENGRGMRAEASPPIKLKGLRKFRREFRRVSRQIVRSPSVFWTRLNSWTTVVPFAG